MKLWAIVEAGKPLRPIELADPEPKGTEVLVKVTHAGVCHSDLHLIKGTYDLGGGKVLNVLERGVELPRAPGHEVLGEVVAFGPEAEGVAVGDSRIVYPWMGCGRCARCRSGEENLCDKPHAIGVVHHGGFGSHVLLPHPRYLFEYGNVDPAVAATFPCSGITVYSAIGKLGELDPDEHVLILGAGGLGFAALAMLHALGHRRVIMADINPDKEQPVLAAGASAFLPADDRLVERAQEKAGGPLKYAMDLVNNGRTTQMALDCLGRGGKLVLLGVAGGEMPLSVAGMIFRPRSVIGSATGSMGDLKAVIRLANEGKLSPVPVTEMPKDQANEALDRLREGRVTGRLVLT